MSTFKYSQSVTTHHIERSYILDQGNKGNNVFCMPQKDVGQKSVCKEVYVLRSNLKISMVKHSTSMILSFQLCQMFGKSIIKEIIDDVDVVTGKLLILEKDDFTLSQNVT